MDSTSTNGMRVIEERTLQYAGPWAVNHARRLLALAARIAADRQYDGTVLRLAAFLHDWGGVDPWRKPDVDHALRSAELIPEVLGGLGIGREVAARVAEAARLHHSCDSTASLEAIILHDADAIDFLGVTGVLRNCAMMTRDLRRAFDRSLDRMRYAREHLVLERSREVARPLLERMERLLSDFQEETGGVF